MPITNDDYRPEDWEHVELAGSQFMATVQDVAFHYLNPGEGWSPWAEDGDTAGLVAEVRAHLYLFEEAAKKARAEIARVERTARLRAGRRERAARP